MTKEISSLKISKIISLHVEGHTQTAISKMLHFDQSTASKYIGIFDNMVKEKGFEAAAAAFGVHGQVEDPQGVVQEFLESDLTTSDVHIALQIQGLLAECGIKPGDYIDFIKAVKKTKATGYVEAAIHLNKLENDTGMNYGSIVATADQKSFQFKLAQEALNKTKHKIASLDAQMKEAEKTTAQATANLKQHMQKIGVDEERLKKVEALALAMKQAGIPDSSISNYIYRQESMNKAGVSINLIDDILAKVKVATKADKGKLLLGMLGEFGGLASAISNQQAQNENLLKEASELEPKAKLKAQMEKEIGQLKSEKASLEPAVGQLKNENAKYRDALAGLYVEWNCGTATVKKLGSTTAELQAEKSKLEDIIETKKKEVSDLDQIKADRDKAHEELLELLAQVENEGRRWQLFEGFLTLVQAKSRQEVVKAIKGFPALLEGLDEDKYPLDLFKNQILGDLGVTLQWAKCFCGVTFFVDKPPAHGGSYHCPIASFDESHNVTVVKQTAAVFGEALVGAKTGGVVAFKPSVTLASGPKPK